MTQSAAESLASKLRIIQNMRAILSMPPSEDLLNKIEEARHAENNTPILSAFLGLLATGEQRNRDIAYTILTDMQNSLASEGEVPASAPTAVEVQPLPEAVPVVAAPEVEASPTPVVAPVTETPAPAASQTIPFCHEGLSETISLRYPEEGKGDQTETVRRYSIIPFDATAELFDGHSVSAIAACILGVKGQPQVEHGFGFTLPFAQEGIAIDLSGKTPWRSALRMGYPTAIPSLDPNAVAHGVPGSAQFLALHSAMQMGYQFLVKLAIIPVNGRFALSMAPEVLLERYSEEGQSMAFDAAHLTQLQFAIAHLDFVGFLALEDVTHG